MKSITRIKKLCADLPVDVVDCGNGHIQLKGKLLVNYYPESKNKTAYVAATKLGEKNVTPEQAVKMCMTQPPKVKGRVKRKKSYRHDRKKLIDSGKDCCHWCGKKLTLDDSTIEHIIPLKRGGLDHTNNRALACYECNSGRGSEMTEIK